jgi:hypothetical protein
MEGAHLLAETDAGSEEWSLDVQNVEGSSREDVPALKGRKINGFGVKYFFSRSSKKRSGSNSSAGGM